MTSYIEAWLAVWGDVNSNVTVMPVPHEMPNVPPRTVDEALAMFDILDQWATHLRSLIDMIAKKERTSARQKLLVLMTERLLRWINIQQMYLNKATNLLMLNMRSPNPEVAKREAFLGHKRELAVRFLAKLKEMQA